MPPTIAESISSQQTTRSGRSLLAGAIGSVVNPVMAVMDINGVMRQIDVRTLLELLKLRCHECRFSNNIDWYSTETG